MRIEQEYLIRLMGIDVNDAPVTKLKRLEHIDTGHFELLRNCGCQSFFSLNSETTTHIRTGRLGRARRERREYQHYKDELTHF